MYTLWRFLESFKVLRSVTSVSFLMVSAIVVVIATITAIAKIAFEDRSLLAIFLLLVTILQVLEFEKKKKSWSYPVSSAMEKPLHGLGVSLR